MNIIFIRILEILMVPYYRHEVLWSIAPLFFALIMIEMYFGKYKTEQLGWNTVFGNNISLIWVNAVVLKYIYYSRGFLQAWNNSELRGYIVLVGIFLAYTVTLAVLNFNHILPKKVAFDMLSTLPTNALAYFVLVIVMGNIPLDRITLMAAIIIFTFLGVLFGLYRKIITPAKAEIPTLKKHEQQRKRRWRSFKRKIKKGIFRKKLGKILYRQKITSRKR